MSHTDPRCPNGGKRGFKTKAKAASFARHNNTSSQTEGRQRPYRCPYCDNWHLTREAQR